MAGVQKHSPGCSCCSSGPAPITIPGCNCNPVPAILDIADTHTPYPCQGGGGTTSFYPTDTITWQAIPAALATLYSGGTTHAFLGDTLFLDSIGELYRYEFRCSGANFTLNRVYEHSIFTGGNAFRDVGRYTWPIASNSCSPFALTVGTDYIAGPSTCDNKVHVTDGT